MSEQIIEQQKEFEKKWHFKVVRPKISCELELPNKEYLVTAALIYPDETIFAIKALDYSLKNAHWFTFRIKEDIDKIVNNIEIIRDGATEFAPKMISEFFMTVEKEDNEYFYLLVSEYFKNGKFIDSPPETQFIKVEKDKVGRKLFVGLNEYQFVYFHCFATSGLMRYIFPVPPNLNYVEDIIQYVDPIRQDILNGDVVYGENRRWVNLNLKNNKNE